MNYCGNATNSKQVDLRHSRGVIMFYFSGLSFRDTRGSEFFRGLSFRDIQGSEFFGSEFSRHPRVWVFSGSEFSRHPRVWVFRVWGLSFRGLSFRDTHSLAAEKWWMNDTLKGCSIVSSYYFSYSSGFEFSSSLMFIWSLEHENQDDALPKRIAELINIIKLLCVQPKKQLFINKRIKK